MSKNDESAAALVRTIEGEIVPRLLFSACGPLTTGAGFERAPAAERARRDAHGLGPVSTQITRASAGLRSSPSD